jgi:ABC-type nitrate/sulfonate/bicarbonate transport system ATPase subunit
MSKYKIGEPVLTIENVSLTLGNNLILNQVNAQVNDIIREDVCQGQIVGFLGPSGIGKTQLFEIIAGLKKPNAGRILIGPEQKEVMPGMVGVVQQNYPLFNHRTVLSNLKIAAYLKHDKKTANEKIADLLDKLDMAKHANKYPGQLSGGQKQRIAIAQQLLCSENILLLDEPFSGLDVLMIEKVSRLIKTVANTSEHFTIIIVSHDIASTAAVADTLWVMGRDIKDKEVVPGSRIKSVYNLAEMGIAWNDDNINTPEFHALVNRIKEEFHTL